MRTEHEQKRRSRRRAFALLLLAVTLALSLTACSGGADGTEKSQGDAADGTTPATSGETSAETSGGDSGGAQEKSQGDAAAIEPGGSLVIPTGEISGTATYYPVSVDGTLMEVIAVKDSGGSIRTAFNTCQVCYDSGRGYYEQQGDVLVCQNCGNQFPMDRVEVEAGGCNPWPIFAENKTVSDDSITISYDFLSESKQIFANWKTEY
ncbi:MAG: DUF2318 domain-containing protein [Clostridiales Family XIII bacterium]|nr:DUF2318 domain-containing protein [Clostridiales Family XIII bacterium]